MTKFVKMLVLGVILSMLFAVPALAQVEATIPEGPVEQPPPPAVDPRIQLVTPTKVRYSHQVVYVHSGGTYVGVAWKANGYRNIAVGRPGCPGKPTGCHTIRLRVKRPATDPNKPTSTVMLFHSSVVNALGQYVTFNHDQRITLTR